MAVLALGFLGIIAALTVFSFAVRDRLAWRLTIMQVKLHRIINPPEKLVFNPEATDNPGAVQTIVKATLDELIPATLAQATHTRTSASVTGTPTPSTPSTASRLPSTTPTPSPAVIPSKVSLNGIRYEYQQFNNCGPANLAMLLSFWGWSGNQNDTRAVLRPNRKVDDKNVNPEEMVAFVQTKTSLRALYRVAGSLEVLKRLIAAGFPVLIEEGHDPADDWWMGHYLVISGYDDGTGRLITQDSLLGPDRPRLYTDFESRWWRDFNYTYLVVYPPDRELVVQEILGLHMDVSYNYQFAAQRALAEIPTLTGRDQLFAWFNLGSSLVNLEDFQGAAEAYDAAFALYMKLPEDDRPYRLMWYQSGPYAAYYHVGRYQDVVKLADITFQWVGQPVLEESYYWRGMAFEALGNLTRAIADLQKAAALNPYFNLPRQELNKLGVQMPLD